MGCALFVGMMGESRLVNESLSSVLLPRLIGSGLAKEMVFTGRVMRAKDAPQGLFNYVVPQEQVVDKGRSSALSCTEYVGMFDLVTCSFGACCGDCHQLKPTCGCRFERVDECGMECD